MTLASNFIGPFGASATETSFEPSTQRYSQAMGTNTTVDVNLTTPVDPAKSFILVDTRSQDDRTPASIKVTTQFINDGATVRLQRHSTADNVIAALQVVSHPDLEVQHGIISADSSDTTVNQAITNVQDLSKAAAIISNRGSGAHDEYDRQQWTARLTSTTNLRVERKAVTGISSTVHYQIIRFLNPGIQVQHSTISISGTTSATAAISSVDTANSFILGSWRFEWGNASANTGARWQFDSSTQLSATKGTSGSGTVVQLMVVSLPGDASVQHDSIATMGQPSNVTINNVDQSKAFTLLSVSNNYPDPGWQIYSATSVLTSATNVAVTRGGNIGDGIGVGRLQTVELWTLPHAPVLYNYDGTNQVAFNNVSQNSVSPTFRVSANHYQNFDRLQLELNTEPDFSGTAYTQNFSGTYVPNTQYNLTADGLSSSLPTTDGVTYYVRVRASHNSGVSHGDWSTGTWAYTYKTSGGFAGWHQSSGDDLTLSGADVFTSSGTFSVPEGVTDVDVLIVGGGGGGAASNSAGGGGGGGRVRWETGVSVTPSGSVAVTVGGGGLGSAGSNQGSDGQSSAFGALTAAGGGGGGGGASTLNGRNGASGGGGVRTGTGGTGSNGGNGGNGFESGTSNLRAGGGGGGAGGNGQVASSAQGGNGGVGVNMSSNIGTELGDNGWFGGGGGGGKAGSGGSLASGGTGGGGTGGRLGTQGTNGMAYTGAGGGASGGDNAPGGHGASGVVIVVWDRGVSLMSSEIDFTWVPGADAWGSATVSPIEGKDLKVSVYYTDTDPCDTIVPNAVLPGNESGFEVSADSIRISLSGLNTDTYQKICLLAIPGESVEPPFFEYWSVGWASGQMRHGVRFEDGVKQPMAL